MKNKFPHDVMIRSMLPLILAVSSCCSDEALPSSRAVRPSPALATAENGIATDSVSDSQEKPVALTSSVNDEEKIERLRKYLEEVQAELKLYPEFPKFSCRITAEPIPEQYVMTEPEKEAYRKNGFDPDAIAKNANQMMAAERAREKRWKELKRTEEDLLILLQQPEK